MPVKTDSRFLLEWARELSNEYPFYDFHIHPYDVFSANVAYRENEQFEGLFSKNNLVYTAPVVDERMEPGASYSASTISTERALLLASRLIYSHTGPKVITDQIEAAGLAGGMLLQVARSPGEAEALLEASSRMFPNNERMYTSCPLPVGTSADKLADYFYEVYNKYGIRAIKVHPNLAGVDPLTPSGHDLIEATLEAAGALELPVIVHGGRTPALKPSEAEEFGMLSRLEKINWSLSSAPVILAHAGCYGLTEDETIVALSRLDTLLHKYPNLMADTSNLEPFTTLRLVLKKISSERLLFGSDALYVSVWKAWLLFLQAVRDVSLSPNDDLIRMASLNPANCLEIVSAH